MLLELFIRNYGLFRETRVEFAPGLNILTGETGAGKSLLVGAVGLIQGKRVDNSAIFLSDEKCIVEARFGHLSPSIRQQLSEVEDFDYEPSEPEVVIRREVTASGKSRAFINDTPVSLPAMKEVCGLLLDLHGQHDNQALLSHEYQLSLVDVFAGNEARVAEFARQLRHCESLFAELEGLQAQAAKAKQELDFLSFQVNELDAANLKPGEEDGLDQEFNLLQHAEGVREALGGAINGLYEQEEEAVYSRISRVVEPLAKFASVSHGLDEEVARLREAQETIQQVAFSFTRLLESIESDPERLAFIEERLATYHKLKLKYGARTGDELIAQLTQLKSRLGDFTSLDDRIGDVKARLSDSREDLLRLGMEIEAARFSVKTAVETAIFSVLKEIGFEKARFEVAIERAETADSPWEIEGRRVKVGSKGFNKVYFLIQSNPGAPAGPLSSIASGGEISRVMLAIKAALAEKAEFPVLIFDEIDTGISGEMAGRVGEVMRRLSQSYQIISITHLPQIAAKGNHHLRIYKAVQNDTTESNLEVLDQPGRVREVAKMLSGEQPTEAALRNAAELMAS